MGIPDEEIAQVRAATDIVALISEHALLKKVGRRWSGLCPFHTEKTPSFSVNAEEGFYYCFGCQASGDAISFVRAMDHLDFVDAVRFLADKAGITLHEDQEAGRDHKRRSELLDAMERAVTWYHERLVSSPDAGPARDYLRSRGYDGEVVRRFRLGWAPDDWDALAKALRLPQNVLSDSGLGFINRRGRAQDFFRARVLFPICDPSGRPVALGGRILPARPGQTPPERPEPKYKNSQESPVYSKRRTLYALNWAKQEVIAQGEVVVCEGYTDVIGFFQAGVPSAVATCGTALAEEHFTLLRNFAKRIVLAYDADAAGQSATSRVYEWERKHEVDVVVAELPGGSDPGELARTDPGALARAVEGGAALPPISGGPDARRRRPDHCRGEGAGRRGGTDRGGRAPRRPGAGPVRDAAGGPLSPRHGQAPGAPGPLADPSPSRAVGPSPIAEPGRGTAADRLPRGRRRAVRPRRRRGSPRSHAGAPTRAGTRGTQVGGAPTR